jgi:hypothetical protein
MSFDTDLTADVSDELFWDPKLDSTASRSPRTTARSRCAAPSGACGRSARHRRLHSASSA